MADMGRGFHDLPANTTMQSISLTKTQAGRNINKQTGSIAKSPVPNHNQHTVPSSAFRYLLST